MEGQAPAARPFEILNLDGLEGAYRTVLSGQRICQLYCFMLLFEVLMKPLVLAFGAAMWLAGLVVVQFVSIAPVPPPDLSTLGTSRTLIELLFVANVSVVYRYYSDFRPAWWALGLCLIALGHNLGVAGLALTAETPVLPHRVGMVDTSAEARVFDTAFMAGMVLSHVYFLWIAVQGQVALHRLDPERRAWLSEYRPDAATLGQSLRGLIGIPGAIRYSARRVRTGALMILAGVANFTNYWRLTMAFLFLCMSPLLVAALFPGLGGAVRMLFDGETLGAGLWRLAIGTLGIVVIGAGLAVVPWIIHRLGRFASARAQRSMRISLHRIQHEDPRAPVLFLRSFLNDRVALPARGRRLERWLLDGQSASLTLDYLVLAEGTAVGPTVALGNPDDPAPPYGVARGYFSHETWQDAVARLCADASAIVMVLDTTEGVQWEIGHIVGRGYLEKTLFLLAPEVVGTAEGRALLGDALTRLTRRPLADVEARLGGTGAGAPIGVQVRQGGRAGAQEGGRIEVITSASASAHAYLVAVRRFFRVGRQGAAAGARPRQAA